MNKKASPHRDAFLFGLSQTGNLTAAADFAGVKRADMLREIPCDEAFARAVKEAQEEAFDRLLYHYLLHVFYPYFARPCGAWL